MHFLRDEDGYLQLLRHILDYGIPSDDRTGVGTLSVFGPQVRYDLTSYFPMFTTKRLHKKSIVLELLWFLRGDTNVRWLQERGVSIWDEWADENGELGPVYGKQWRSWPGKIVGAPDRNVYGHPFGVTLDVPMEPTNWEPIVDGDTFDAPIEVKQETIDQITNVIGSLRKNPRGRRHIVSAWNPAEVDDMKLPPCHCLFQFYARPLTRNERWNWHSNGHRGGVGNRSETELDELGIPRYYLDCQLYQRSADMFLGVPFNVVSYALLTHMIAQQVNMVPGEFVHTLGDAHIYKNHVEQVREQLSREILPHPQLQLRKRDSIFDYELTDVQLIGYKPHSAISAPIAV